MTEEFRTWNLSQELATAMGVDAERITWKVLRWKPRWSWKNPLRRKVFTDLTVHIAGPDPEDEDDIREQCRKFWLFLKERKGFASTSYVTGVTLEQWDEQRSRGQVLVRGTYKGIVEESQWDE